MRWDGGVRGVGCETGSEDDARVVITGAGQSCERVTGCVV